MIIFENVREIHKFLVYVIKHDALSVQAYFYNLKHGFSVGINAKMLDASGINFDNKNL